MEPWWPLDPDTSSGVHSVGREKSSSITTGVKAGTPSLRTEDSLGDAQLNRAVDVFSRLPTRPPSEWTAEDRERADQCVDEMWGTPNWRCSQRKDEAKRVGSSRGQFDPHVRGVT